MAVNRTEVLQFHLTPDEKALLTEVAKREGRPMASLIRWLVAQHAKQAGIKTAAAA
jgi:hypothetical protein